MEKSIFSFQKCILGQSGVFWYIFWTAVICPVNTSLRKAWIVWSLKLGMFKQRYFFCFSISLYAAEMGWLIAVNGLLRKHSIFIITLLVFFYLDQPTIHHAIIWTQTRFVWTFLVMTFLLIWSTLSKKLICANKLLWNICLKFLLV